MDATFDLVYLMGCALRGTAPRSERVIAMDMEALRAMARRHKVGAMAAMVLEGCLPSPEEVLGAECWREWARLRDSALRRSVLFDTERARHLAFFEANGIRYMPLKGILLQELYPRFGMREMADNDILFDEAFRERVHDYMLADGYTAESYKEEIHDCYFKKPVYNFEFHTALFTGMTNSGALERYYADVWARTLPDRGSELRRRLSDEDFYIYVCAHAYKHYDAKGVGLRVTADNYIMRRSGELDWTYIDRELAVLGALDFDRTLRSLSEHLYDDPETVTPGNLPEDEKRMLGYLSGSGAYGVRENVTLNRLRHIREEGSSGAAARGKFLLRRLFPGREHMKLYAPITAKYPILLPGAYLWRIAKAAFCRRDSIHEELEIVRNASEEEK